MMTFMNESKLFPLIVTDKLEETKAFYTKTAGWSITHEMPGYLQVRSTENAASPELSFMKPDHSSPLGALPVFDGKGLIVSVPTENADTAHSEFKAAGAPMVAGPTDKPWGWRSFMVRDPNGLILDFFHEVDQSPTANAPS